MWKLSALIFLSWYTVCLWVDERLRLVTLVFKFSLINTLKTLPGWCFHTTMSVRCVCTGLPQPDGGGNLLWAVVTKTVCCDQLRLDL